MAGDPTSHQGVLVKTKFAVHPASEKIRSDCAILSVSYRSKSLATTNPDYRVPKEIGCEKSGLVLRKLGADPVIASSIFLTTGTNVASMGLLLGLATILVK